jgi:hypothetical protein
MFTLLCPSAQYLHLQLAILPNCTDAAFDKPYRVRALFDALQEIAEHDLERKTYFLRRVKSTALSVFLLFFSGITYGILSPGKALWPHTRHSPY